MKAGSAFIGFCPAPLNWLEPVKKPTGGLSPVGFCRRSRLLLEGRPSRASPRRDHHDHLPAFELGVRLNLGLVAQVLLHLPQKLLA